MDLSYLAALGKVAGIGGMALGVVALLVRPVIDRASGVPPAQRGPLLRSIAMGAFGMGALGIVAWLVSSLSGGTTVTAGSGGVAGGRDVSGNTVTLSQPPQDGGSSPTGSGVSAARGGVAGGRDVTGNKVTIGPSRGGDTSASAPTANPGAKSP
jgi:hypothetical protein